ncbi:MAG: hypothetical protein A3J48_03215 [Candidatus Doudnabacteria bacterium RIFCSPHIGHO2_02_FULL_46_11]|uniref:Uncharacterized protein n=1 Tax=Candidatus Doudnabacteria bacterium RIFCSPHIGHO2_02_FULL_46_11 TaxID=1817832 RepID=A0A1F5P7V3_9BACT|nr:MAG: hypothetical protein A3J48_03215 [Candidatus Doudnabacteria bacterium RIFCSPHIGHO2_02_FULL_46_11]
MEVETKRKIRKGTKIVTKWLEATGIPDSYSASMAWFAERTVLAILCLMVLSFASGVFFVMRLSEPIGNSVVYNAAARRAELAEQGIKVVSQQVIDVASPVFTALIKGSRDEKELLAEELALRKEKLKQYLASYNSPFAEDDGALEAFATSKNMKLMVAISFVESTFGKHCYYYNCSGIGGTPPTLRKYDSYAEWIQDFDDLLERRYKDLPPEEFIGLYVQPGSPSWLYGVKQVLSELQELGV